MKFLLSFPPIILSIMLSACGGGSSGSLNNTDSNNSVVTSSQATGTANLSWVAPSKNVDGSPLTLSTIAGYRIYHGITNGNLSLLYDVSDGSITHYTVVGLKAGTHYFALTTYNIYGQESAYSRIVSKTIHNG